MRIFNIHGFVEAANANIEGHGLSVRGFSYLIQSDGMAGIIQLTAPV
jgi:hypothetical protein